MKRTFLIMVALVFVSAALFSCGGTLSGDSFGDVISGVQGEITSGNAVSEFMKFIKSGEYLKAGDCYTEKIYGNLEIESKAAGAIVDFCEEINSAVLSGECTEKDAKNKMSVIDKALDNANVSLYEYENMEAKIDKSIASRAAYLAAVELENLGIYADAIIEYGKVIAEDSGYNDAKEAIDRCTTILKQDVFDKVESLVESGEYAEAISQLKTLKEKIPNDEEIVAKITVYEKTYISKTVEAAEEIFIKPAEDYLKALEIINAALQHYPTNSELMEKKDYYESFAPVKLASLSKYDTSGKYGPTFLETEEDPLGTIHTDVFRTWSYMYETAWVVYVLDGKYNKLTFNVYGTLPSDGKVASVSIRDYSKGDYDLSTTLYINETLKRGVFPFEVEVDVTGVKMIRVFVEHGIAVADAKLQKTVK